jgi:ectoine hydroxylase-related dioxygenase (phytanoyl-CoA dioxygenase family)
MFFGEKLLTAEQKRYWEKNGYLILERFFQPREVEAVNTVVQRIVDNPGLSGNATVDPLTGEHAGKRFRATEAPKEVFHGPVKINDLFLEQAEVRALALDEKLTKIISTLFGGAPLVCNSLNFIWGSTQPDHFDTWYMPPRVPNKMVVSSICLEDVHPDAGPLVFYPGTHKIPPYRFSHGGIHAVPAEMDAARAYITKKLAETSAERKEFLGRAGDVFLWHGQLFHGGSAIKDHNRTRKTLVTHYWRAQDVEPSRRAKVHATGYYELRQHQAAG